MCGARFGNNGLVARGDGAHCTRERLLRAVGYVTPDDVFAGRQKAIRDERDRKFEEARTRRAGQRRAEMREEVKAA